MYEKTLSEIEKKSGKKDTAYAIVGNDLAFVYVDLGLISKADSLFQIVKEVTIALYGKKHVQYATLADNLGTLYYYKEDYDNAIYWMTEAKNLLGEIKGKKSEEYMTLCINLALLHKTKEAYKEAEKLYQEAKEICIAILGKEHDEYATICNNIASLYLEQSRYDEAEILMQEAIQTRAKTLGKKHPKYALLLINLGDLYSEIGKYNKAYALIKEGMDIYSTTFGKKHPKYAFACEKYGLLYVRQNLLADAEKYFNTAIEIIKEVSGAESIDYAYLAHGIASTLLFAKKYKEAEDYFIKAKDIIFKKLGLGKNYLAICHNLAALYEASRNYSKAESLYTFVRENRSKILGKDNFEYGITCNNLGYVYDLLNKSDKAEQLYKEANIILKNYKHNSFYLTNVLHLAKLYWKYKNLSLSDTLLIQCTNLVKNELNTNFMYLSQKEKEIFIQNLNDVIQTSYNYMIQNKKMASYSDWLYQNTLMTKSIIFSSSQHLRKLIENSKDTQMIALYDSLLTHRKNIIRYSNLTQKPKNINLDSLENISKDIEKQLYQKFANDMSISTYSWKDVQKQLNSSEALVEIIHIRNYDLSKDMLTDSVLYGCFIITKKDKQKPYFFILPYGNQLENQYIINYRRCMSNKIEDNISYYAFWGEIKKHLQGIKKVYFSSDGVYHQINLNTLYNPDTKKYLIDEIKIQLVTNGKNLIEIKSDKEKEEDYQKYKIYLFGYPKYGDHSIDSLYKNDNKRSLIPNEEVRFFDISGRVSMLPGTKDEVDTISYIAKMKNINFKKYLYEEASEENLKRIESPDILHIATHGFFRKNVEKQNGAKYNIHTDNPLKRSGLLFAGCESYLNNIMPSDYRKEDGILTAEEVLELNMRNTKLVVLSACETGLGEVKNGEGVYGLQRTIQMAGAKNILMSMWKIDDKATNEFMAIFYQNILLKKYSVRKALENTQKRLREKYPHPYYWGSFVIIGKE